MADIVPDPRQGSSTVQVDAALLRLALLGWQEGPESRSAAESTDEDFYEGLPAQIALLADGRQARLLAPISFTQASGTRWDVPMGSLLDGASIPRLFWTLIGGPFEGRYRDGSIVHDHYCVTMDRSWRDTHRMFYDAMRCSGVGAAKARIMYYAVYRFGPRWADSAAEGVAPVALPPPGAPAEAVAPEIAADAEAIAVHGLDLDEIDALADARAATSAAESLDDDLARARLLVVPGGSGTPDDLAVVAVEAARLPGFVLDRFERERIRIIACRGGVTDFERSLAGVTPRGWEGTGRTWDNVPGTYLDADKRVVIATIEQNNARAVPTKESRLHGSANLVVHESLHGFDYSTRHVALADTRFTDARASDFDKLGVYEQQAGQAGAEETFAESGARAVVEQPALATDWPHLADYWQQGPVSAESAREGIAPDETEDMGDAGADLGTATLGADDTILLDLRAEGPGGAIGHAAFSVAPGDPAYARLRDHLFPAGSAAEGVESENVPFRPLPQAAPDERKDR